MKAEDKKYGRPYRFDEDFDFDHVVKRLSLPDITKR